MRKWQPTYNLHWAVLLNRQQAREIIITIRGLRNGTTTGDEAYWLKRLASVWKMYRLFMAEREFERRAWLDTRAALQMSKAIFAPMMRVAP